LKIILSSQTECVSDYPTIESRGYRDCTEDCYDKYLNWNVYQTLCLMKCSAFNRKIEVNVDLVEKPVAEMEAHYGFDSLCAAECGAKHQNTVAYMGCLAWCGMHGFQNKNSYKMEPTASKRPISFSRPAQSINKGQLQITQIISFLLLSLAFLNFQNQVYGLLRWILVNTHQR
jgi:hypothetical protein